MAIEQKKFNISSWTVIIESKLKILVVESGSLEIYDQTIDELWKLTPIQARNHEVCVEDECGEIMLHYRYCSGTFMMAYSINANKSIDFDLCLLDGELSVYLHTFAVKKDKTLNYFLHGVQRCSIRLVWEDRVIDIKNMSLMSRSDPKFKLRPVGD